MSSRVIVKNIPPYVTDKRLREHFSACGEITDCRIQTTKGEDGVARSRRFCFLGFKLSAETQRCVQQMHQTYFDTQKICVEIARPVGSSDMARPWSKYSHGSSAHKRQNPEKYAAEEEAKRLAKKAKEQKPMGVESEKNKENDELLDEFLQMGKKRRKNQVIKEAAQASVATPEKPNPESQEEDKKATFDSSLSDLAWLKQQRDTSVANDDVDPGVQKKDETGNTAINGAEEGTDRKEVVQGQTAVEGSGRLYVTNLPYVAAEDEVKEFFGKHGPIAIVKICNNEDTLKSRGFCYVTYVFPEHALKVLATLDMPEFQGRLLRIAAATDLPAKEEEKEDGKASFKKKKEKQKKEVDAHQERTWNLLYMSSASANTSMASQLGIEKRELMKKDEGDLAVTQALAETHILQETKQWLQREGIHVDAFTRTGASLKECAQSSTTARRNDTIIIKHLPPGVDAVQLRDRFGRYGELIRCALAPSKTVAVVQYTEPSQAKAAFQKLAFSRFLHVPLYLEWAPEEIFVDEAKRVKVDAVVKQDEGEKIDAPVATIFIKNLNFKTTDTRLAQEFASLTGFRKATIMKKKKAMANGKSEELSMGYGFLEFQSAELALEVIKKKQKCMIDGHAVQLQISSSKSSSGSKQETEEKRGGSAPVSNKLCVRNLAFEANKKELRALFSTFGTVTSLRIPKKPGGNGHRGFAFLDFLTKQEALTAYEALQHTHFYGRHLVIEPAEKEAETVEELRAKQASMEDKKGKFTESRKRKRAADLETSGVGFDKMALD
eukprot:GEMP01011264.1.p1 GENE.GEMP01011264.1~~GEMP01011264.1.p1  ORF type:complete len:778 (+),score=188.79 GEMP01011264.1:2-2335(+)